MSRVAKWILILAVGGIASTITMRAILYLASGNSDRWTMATAGAVAVLGLAAAIGATWVNRPHSPPPAGSGNQTLTHAKIKGGRGDGPVIGIAGDVSINSDSPARRGSRRTKPPVQQ